MMHVWRTFVSVPYTSLIHLWQRLTVSHLIGELTYNLSSFTLYVQTLYFSLIVNQVEAVLRACSLPQSPKQACSSWWTRVIVRRHCLPGLSSLGPAVLRDLHISSILHSSGFLWVSIPFLGSTVSSPWPFPDSCACRMTSRSNESSEEVHSVPYVPSNTSLT